LSNSDSLYLPQSSRSLLLVDVEEVAHHAALDQAALRLHADLEDKTGWVNKLSRDNESTQPEWNAEGQPSQIQGCLNLGNEKAKG